MKSKCCVNFSPGAAKAPFRLGHKMDLLKLAEADVDRGVMVTVREKGLIGCVLWPTWR